MAAESLGELLDELQGLRERATPGEWGWFKHGPRDETGRRMLGHLLANSSFDEIVLCPADGADIIGMETDADTITASVNLLQPLIDVARAAEVAQDAIVDYLYGPDEDEEALANTQERLYDRLAALRDAILSQNMEGRS